MAPSVLLYLEVVDRCPDALNEWCQLVHQLHAGMTALCLRSAALSREPANSNVQRGFAPLSRLCSNAGLLAQEVGSQTDDLLQVLQSFLALILRAQGLLIHVSYGQTFYKVDQDVKGEAVHQ